MMKPTIEIEEIAPGVWNLAGRGQAKLEADNSPIVSIRSVAVRDDGVRFYGRNDREALLAAYHGSDGRKASWQGTIVSWG